MDGRSEIPPDTLPVTLTDGGVQVEYTDGRRVFYHGVPTPVEGTITTSPGKDVHVLVTDESGTEGVLVYVNERKTEDDILEDSGVGRILIDPDEEASVFPGVSVTGTRHRVDVTADFETVEGRIFVFEEDELGERSYELVAED